MNKQSALERLEKWVRKHYWYIINNGYVRLSGGPRTVHADEDEETRYKDDGFDIDYYPSLEDLIHLALDRWEQDDSIKYYHVLWSHHKENPDFNAPKEVLDWGEYTGPHYLQAVVAAKNDADVKNIISSGYSNGIIADVPDKGMWEIGEQYTGHYIKNIKEKREKNGNGQ